MSSIAPIAPDLIGRQLARIMASPVFAGSPRMARFLEFAVRETLSGNAAVLKEIVIGASVFDRDANYDPRLDPIVRVEARRLRSKLQAYYEGAGRDDEIVIEFPRGRYAPVFRQREPEKPHYAQSAPRNVKSIVILPFRSLHEENDGEYLADGLTEELIHALTRTPRLRVVAWNSASRLRNQDADLEAIRQKLDVGYVLSGCVRKTGQRLRVTAQLVDTGSGEYLWSETYDRQLDDVFRIQEQIAAALASSLKLRIVDAPGRNTEDTRPRRPECVDAWQICLKGRFHARDRGMDGLRRSAACFEQAVAVCPESASAWAGLADSYTLLADYDLAKPADVLPKARAAAERALALDPWSDEAHASLGLILCVYEWQWDASARYFRRAIELNPGYAAAHYWYGLDHLAMRGHFDRARTHIEEAIRLDPLSSNMLEARAFLHILERDYDAAIRECRIMIQNDPSFYKGWAGMGRALIQMGSYRDAVEALKKGLLLAGDLPSIFGALGQAYALAGETAEARALLARLHPIDNPRPVRSTCFALVYLGLGEMDAALTHLERAVEAREPSVCGFGVHPVWDPLRSEPRFQQMLKQAGF